MQRIIRDRYLNELVSLRGNGFIKVVTGMRRCGKSYLLFQLFVAYLTEHGVPFDHIIRVDLEDISNKRLRNPEELYSYVQSRIVDNETHYVLLDEVQMLDEFEDVLNGLLKQPQLDIYVTGSNARFLSRDVITEFRGRGYEIRLYPLSFKEYVSAFNGSKQAALGQYMLYGGLPQVLALATDEQRSNFLKSLFAETYIRDIKERYKLVNDSDLEELINIMASGVGTLTNPNKLTDTFRSVKKSAISYDRVKTYIDYLCDSFLVEKATRYDIKGRRYVNAPFKYYFMDLGLRNARINFRQYDPGHLMENLIYNELRQRGFNVDVGVVSVTVKDPQGNRHRSNLEVDFICNMGSRRYYIQSAYQMVNEEKVRQERASLVNVHDSFKKIIVVGDECPVTHDEHGVTTMSIYDFLLRDNSLEL